jgi:hypothetical protein
MAELAGDCKGKRRGLPWRPVDNLPCLSEPPT